MSHFKIIMTTGIAMFAMFFGSGNLVFPLQLGVMSHGHYALANLGLLITGVLIPFLGLWSMMLYNGNRDQYFGLLGKFAPFIVTSVRYKK
ncbi:MAG: branched-chain amino acid transport system II carrier protein [Proteobacteria bacterium]|nr:branched-chain amino acid transport system II carrier protein [Pseudomonadota bacterium]